MFEMKKVKITKVKSTIKRPKSQKATMVALGLNKMYSSSIKEMNPAMSGMISKVSHLLRIEEVN
jgi:large subunit ribosomal protein L30